MNPDDSDDDSALDALLGYAVVCLLLVAGVGAWWVGWVVALIRKGYKEK